MPHQHIVGFAESVAKNPGDDPERAISEMIRMVAAYGEKHGYEYSQIAFSAYFCAGGDLAASARAARKLRNDEIVGPMMDAWKEALLPKKKD